MQMHSVPHYQVLHGGKQQVFISTGLRTSGLTLYNKSAVASIVKELALVRSYNH